MSRSHDKLYSYQSQVLPIDSTDTIYELPTTIHSRKSSANESHNEYYVPTKNSARKETRKSERTPSMLLSLERVKSLSSPNTTLQDTIDGAKDLHNTFLSWNIRADYIVLSHKLKYHYILATLLLFSPLGIAASIFSQDATTIFILNFFAVIPLAWLLEEMTEQLALHCSQSVAGLINVTLGNAEELIISVVALRKGLLDLVQTSLLGSIFSNLLLVLGCSFLAGGMKRSVTHYNRRGAQLSCSMLMFAAMSFVLPNVFTHTFRNITEYNLLMISRLIAVIVFIVYILYLVFQLKTHKHWFVDNPNNDHSDSDNETDTLEGNAKGLKETDNDSDNETEQADLSGLGSLLLLALVTILICVQSDLLVDSIEGVVNRWHIPQSFIGLILLPVVGNACEHATAVTVAYKDKMSLAIGIAVGSAVQIALCLLPFITIVAWTVSQPLTLNFGTFESVSMILSVLMVTSLLKDGESSWIQGAMLCATYFMIAIAFYFHPRFTDNGTSHEFDY